MRVNSLKWLIPRGFAAYPLRGTPNAQANPLYSLTWRSLTGAQDAVDL